MKVVFPITLIFILAFVHGQNQRPCLRNPNNNAYEIFVRRHIVKQPFDRNSADAWRTYLQENDFCKRPRQTFMEHRNQFDILQICQGFGWRYNLNSNLCISIERIQVYELKVNNNCQVRILFAGQRHVVVACDAIRNVCRPSHFQLSTDSGPNMQNGRCE